MNQTQTTQLALLAESIIHWQANLDAARNGDEINPDGEYCPLCQEYGEECEGCPISEDTHDTCCKGTPWIRVNESILEDDYPITTEKAVLDELEYLQDLYERLEEQYLKEDDE